MRTRPTTAAVVTFIASTFAVTPVPVGAAPTCTTTCYVNATSGDDANSGSSAAAPLRTITAALASIHAGGEIRIAAGKYVEDVVITTDDIQLTGPDPEITTISGPAGGPAATISVEASGIELWGLTISREGNVQATWVAGLNTSGVSIRGQAHDADLRNVWVIGNQLGIEIDDSDGNSIRSTSIRANHVGVVLRNRTGDTLFDQNVVRDNRTFGVLFEDGSGGSNVPAQTAASSRFTHSVFRQNWYGDVVDRQTGGALATPGTSNLKNFSSNDWGRKPVVDTSDPAAPAYATHVPVEAGGTASSPLREPADITGPAAANVDYTPFKLDGWMVVHQSGPQAGSLDRIQEAVGDIDDTTQLVRISAGSYQVSAPITIDRQLVIRGPVVRVHFTELGQRREDVIPPNDPDNPAEPNPARPGHPTVEATITPTGDHPAFLVRAQQVQIEGLRFTDPGTSGASNTPIIAIEEQVTTPAQRVFIESSIFDEVERTAVGSTGGTALGRAVIAGNRITAPTRAPGCGPAGAPSDISCHYALFDIAAQGLVQVAGNVVLGSPHEQDGVRVLDLSFPRGSPPDPDPTSDQFDAAMVLGNVIRDACSRTCFSFGKNVTSANVRRNDIVFTDPGHPIVFTDAWTGGQVSVDHNILIGGDNAVVIANPTADVGGLHITRNTVVSHLYSRVDGGGVVNNAAGPVDATCNWWGTAAGPNSTNDNHGNVLVRPWLVSSDLDGPCAGVSSGLAPATAVTGPAGSELTNHGSFNGNVNTITIEEAAPDDVPAGNLTLDGSGGWTWRYTSATTETGTVTIVATDHYGDRAEQTFQYSVNPVTPSQPRAVTATALLRSAVVSWDVPASTGGSPITSYRATASPGGRSCTTSATSYNCVIDGLAPGAVITFTVAATNVAGTGPESAPSAPVVIEGPTLTPMSPERLVDTRPGEPQGTIEVEKKQYGGPVLLEVEVTGIAGVPAAGVTAVALNVTAVTPAGDGFVTAYPCGVRPLAATLTFTSGETVPGMVVAPVSAGGTICFYANVSTHLVIDLSGWLSEGAEFHSLVPTRVTDTRPDEPVGAVDVPKQTYGPTNILRVRIAGAAGVPTTGVAGVALNVTAVGAAADGYLTVFPCDNRPLAANVTYVRGEVVSNAVVAGLSNSGEICVFSYADAHIVIDVTGWFGTNSSFHPSVPLRAVDTRAESPQGAVVVAQQRYGGEAQVLRVRLTGVGRVPASGISAVVVNVTAVDPLGDGYVTAYPCGARPLAANLNYVAHQTVPNLVIAPVSSDGDVCFFSYAATHLVVDIAGWFDAA